MLPSMSCPGAVCPLGGLVIMQYALLIFPLASMAPTPVLSMALTASPTVM